MFFTLAQHTPPHCVTPLSRIARNGFFAGALTVSALALTNGVRPP